MKGMICWQYILKYEFLIKDRNEKYRYVTARVRFPEPRSEPLSIFIRLSYSPYIYTSRLWLLRRSSRVFDNLNKTHFPAGILN